MTRVCDHVEPVTLHPVAPSALTTAERAAFLADIVRQSGEARRVALASLPSASPEEVRAVEAFEAANAHPRVRRVISARCAQPRPDECPACEGSGGRLLDDWGYERDDCRTCGGTGLRTVSP